MDLLLWDGDVVWQGDDILLCDGVSNKVQQAYLETITDKGESVFYPEYGTKIYQKIGKVLSSGNKELIQQEILAVFADMDGAILKELTLTEVAHGWKVNVKFVEQDGKEEQGYFVIGGDEPYELANER